MELEGREVSQTLKENIASSSHVYAQLNAFVTNVIKTFSEKASNNRTKISNLENAKMQHHKRERGDSWENADKGYVKDVFFTSKDLLDYVLDYFATLGFLSLMQTNENLLFNLFIYSSSKSNNKLGVPAF